MSKKTGSNLNFRKVKVVGVGGAGLNTVASLINDGLVERKDCVAIGFDPVDLRKSRAVVKVYIRQFKGKLFGSIATTIRRHLAGTDGVYIVAGLGGRATDLMPLVCGVARKAGIRVTGYVYTPFKFEGEKRVMKAQVGTLTIKRNADKLLVFSNESFFRRIDEKTTTAEAFRLAENGLRKMILTKREKI